MLEITEVLRKVIGLFTDDFLGRIAYRPTMRQAPRPAEPGHAGGVHYVERQAGIIIGHGQVENLPHDRVYRTAFYATTRMLLELAWKDAGQPCPHPREAEEQYGWHGPSQTVAEQAAELLADLDLANLDGDVLGPVFEAQLDDRERRNKGAFYTPAPLVRFLWDRSGFTPETVFCDADDRHPPRIADFSAGSGAFLVEAARRIREAVLRTLDPTAQDLRLAVAAIGQGLCGVEVNGFACYLTQANLLLQLAPLVSALHEKGEGCVLTGEDLKLSVLHDDALRLHETASQDMLQNGQFDYVCSNPPYLGEKGNQKVFRQVLDALPYWKPFYQGKMDYLYWFIILGLSRLRQGGRLAYVTTGYWHTADGASVLRRYILDHAKIFEMIDFGPVRPFPDAQGQHTMVFVLERCDDEQQRRGHRPKLVQVRQQGHCLDTLLDHIQVKLDAPVGESYEDDCIRVFWSPVLQNELSESAWHIFQDHETAAVLRQLAGAGEALGRVCEYVQGVVSGADRVTRAHFRHLAPEVVDQHGIHEGDGIFVLSAEELASLSLSDHERTLVKRTYKNSQVARYLVDADGDPPEFLLYVAPGCGFSPSATPALYTHLEKYRGILQKKRECHLIDQRTGQPYRQWFELHWPRDERALSGEKIVTPRRAAENRFALAGGDVYENSDLAVLVKRPGVREGLKYLLALLNSAALDFWCAHRCKRKGKIREYYRTPLQEVPIRRIRFEPATAEGLKRAAIGQLRADLDSERYDTALARLRCALDAAQEDVVHDGLELLVDRMVQLTARLAAENARVGLRLTRLRADAPLPPTVPAAMLESSPVPEIRRAMSQTQSIIDSVVWSLYDIPSPTPQSTNP